MRIKLKRYRNTMNFIFELAANRIYAKKEDEKLTNYEIAGYESLSQYEILKDDLQATEYNPDIVKRMTGGSSNKKRFDYFLTKRYARLFVQNLNFTNLHEVYWGTNEEIKGYIEELFYYLLEDLKYDPYTKNNIKGLLDLKTKEEIFSVVEKEFWEMFYQFTLGKIIKRNNFEIVNFIDEKIKFSKMDEILKFSENESLTFKKLYMNIEKFSHEKVLPLLALELITAL